MRDIVPAHLDRAGRGTAEAQLELREALIALAAAIDALDARLERLEPQERSA